MLLDDIAERHSSLLEMFRTLLPDSMRTARGVKGRPVLATVIMLAGSPPEVGVEEVHPGLTQTALRTVDSTTAVTKCRQRRRNIPVRPRQIALISQREMALVRRLRSRREQIYNQTRSTT